MLIIIPNKEDGSVKEIIDINQSSCNQYTPSVDIDYANDGLLMDLAELLDSQND